MQKFFEGTKQVKIRGGQDLDYEEDVAAVKKNKLRTNKQKTLKNKLMCINILRAEW